MKRALRILTILSVVTSASLFATPSQAASTDRWVAAIGPSQFYIKDISGLSVGTTVIGKSVGTPNNLFNPFPANVTIAAISISTFVFNLCFEYVCDGSSQFASGDEVYSITLNKSVFNFYTLAEFTFDADVTTAPGAPTSVIAASTGPTTAIVSFVAPASDGGATIETYTATSSPGGITGFISQAGSGTISITGLSSSTAYTFTVTASNSAGTSSPSLASVSIITPASAEELAEQAAQAARAAAIKREADKRSAREEIIERFKISETASLELFNRAEIFGITPANIDELHAEISALPKELQREITQVLKIARKYEILGIIASERVKTIYSNSLIEIGLIPTDSRNKSTLTRVVKELSQAERSTYASIKDAIEIEIAVIQARKDRLAKVLAINASRRNS